MKKEAVSKIDTASFLCDFGFRLPHDYFAGARGGAYKIYTGIG